MCSIALDKVSSALAALNRLVSTLRPVRAANVRGRTNSSAERVITTCTANPRSISARESSAALYAAMPPPTPRATLVVTGIAGYRNAGSLLFRDGLLEQVLDCDVLILDQA